MPQRAPENETPSLGARADPLTAYRGLPPGWYRDNEYPTLARYWDGSTLSEERRPISQEQEQSEGQGGLVAEQGNDPDKDQHDAREGESDFSSSTPAGWFPDSNGNPTILRFWDGTKWTSWTKLLPTNPIVVAPARSSTNGFCVASLVLGLVPIVPFVGSILAIVFGAIGKRQVTESNRLQGGRLMAIWGVVLGVLGVVGSIILVVLVVVASDNSQNFQSSATKSGNTGSSPLIGETHAPAPPFSLHDLQNPSRVVTLSSFLGHGVVLNFWSSWCVPCNAESQLLQSASVSTHGRLRFVGVDTNDSEGSALAFANARRLSYVLLYDPTGQVASEYGLFGLPGTVFISPSGRVIGRHLGALDQATLAAALQSAFGIAGS